MNRIRGLLGAATVAALIGVTATEATAQDYKPLSINARAGIAVPSGSIADIAKSGAVFGGGLGYNLGRVELRANADFGKHDVKVGPAPASGDLKINVNHFIVGAGYHLIDPRGENKVRLSVNLGAGAMTFKVDQSGAETDSFFAINAGAEAGYELSRSFEIFLNLQGDIAFKNKDELDLGTNDSTAWVWPLTAGLKLRI
jgi:hypothetical protein